jgi:predicted transcriptional regulator
MTPVEIIQAIENARIEIKVKKGVLAKEAGLHATHYSYLLKRAQEGKPLDSSAVKKVIEAIYSLVADHEVELAKTTHKNLIKTLNSLNGEKE